MMSGDADAADLAPSPDFEARLALAEAALAEERRRADALNRIAAAIGAGGSLEDVVQAAVDGAVELTGAAFGAFFYNVVDEADGSYTLYALSGAPRSAFERFPMPRATKIFEPTFRGKAVVLSDDITQDPRYGHSPPYHGMPEGHLPVRSYLAAPVISPSGEVLGGLFFGHPEPAVFTQRQAELLEGLGAQAAVAIDNHRLNAAVRAELDQRRRTEAALAASEERFGLVADSIPIMCWIAESGGDILWFNQRWYDYTGGTPEQMLGRGWRVVPDPAHGPEIRAAWAAAFAARRPFEMVFPLRAADGTYRPFLTRVEPTFDESGAVVRWFGVAVDMAGEIATRERLMFALEAGRLGSWELDVESRRYEASDLCKANYGRGPDQAFTFDELIGSIHPEDRSRMREAIEDAIRTGAEYDIEYRVVHPTGDVRWIQARGRADRAARRMAGVSLDITERKTAEERQRLLLNELNHRVKNTLATVQSIARQTLRGASDGAPFREAFEARLLALSKTHNLLTDQKWAGASLHAILATELTPHAGGREGGGARFLLESGCDVRLTPKAAVALGMAVHELATNAVKYGALSTPAGRVVVQAKVVDRTDGRRLLLDWIESGGPPVRKPSRRGFGGRLLEQGLARELAGEVRLHYDPAGLSCRMDLPMHALEPKE